MSSRQPPADIRRAVRNWLTPGIGIKRWLIVLAVGVVAAGLGFSALLAEARQGELLPAGASQLLGLEFLPLGLRVALPLLIGGALMLWATIRLGANLLAPFRRPDEAVSTALSAYSARGRGPNIVAIGGGTGLPGLLRGLTEFTSNVSAIVTVADDGGSSGRLREELGVIPPGDFRNNIAALAQDEALMTQLLQYRFGARLGSDGDHAGEGALHGHAFGNLLLAALVGVTGSFDEALLAAGRVLAMRGQVLPSTLANVRLVAHVLVGEGQVPRRVVGESKIPGLGGRIQRVSLEPARVPAYPAAVKAILNADMVLIGPGSLYTSILPNLLVADVARALQRTRASRVYVCNLATQPGETDNYTVEDHVAAISRHLANHPHDTDKWVDVVLVNSNLTVPATTGGGQTVYVKTAGGPLPPVAAYDLVDEERPWRHDSHKLARAVKELLHAAGS